MVTQHGLQFDGVPPELADQECSITQTVDLNLQQNAELTELKNLAPKLKVQSATLTLTITSGPADLGFLHDGGPGPLGATQTCSGTALCPPSSGVCTEFGGYDMCAFNMDQSTCSQPGCVWTPSNDPILHGRCSAKPCSTFKTESDCKAAETAPGCAWACSDIPPPCASVPLDQCTSTPGCGLSTTSNASNQSGTNPSGTIDGDPHSSQCPGNSIYDSHGCGHVSLAGSCKSGNVTIINGSYYCDQNELQFCKDGNLTTVIDCHSCKHYWSGGVDSTICWDEDPDTEDTQRLSSQSGPGCYFASSRECSP